MATPIDIRHRGLDRVICAWEVEPGVIVDPGPASTVENLLAQLEAEPRVLLLTHIHLDHAGATGVLAAVSLLWRRLLAATVHEDLARVEGVAVGRLKLAFVLLLSITIAAAMKIVGVLLITALLIIPAATARRAPLGLATSAEKAMSPNSCRCAASSAASASAGTLVGDTKAVTSTSRTPVAATAASSSSLASNGMGVSICSPSRRQTSRIVTRCGSCT